MEEPAAKFDTLLNHLKEFSRYHTGYPRQEQVSRVLEFKSERQFVELLHQGEPVAVAFTLKCPWTRRFDHVLEDAAAECYPHIKFVRVECPKYPGFCIARQRKDYPFVEIFHSPQPSQTQEGVKDRSISRYSVNVRASLHAGWVGINCTTVQAAYPPTSIKGCPSAPFGGSRRTDESVKLEATQRAYRYR